MISGWLVTALFLQADPVTFTDTSEIKTTNGSVTPCEESSKHWSVADNDTADKPVIDVTDMRSRESRKNIDAGRFGVASQPMAHDAQ